MAKATDVRSYFRSNPKAFGALGEAAQATVRPQDEGKTLRGRLHPEAIAAFNAANTEDTYVLGSTTAAKTVAVKGVKFTKNAVRRPTVEVEVAEARETLALAGIEVGARGRLPGAAVEALGAMTVL